MWLHLLLCAWRQCDLTLFEFVIGNGDNPFAAFALDFETISTKFGDKLTAFASGFDRILLSSGPLSVSIKIHLIKKQRKFNKSVTSLQK